MRTAQELEAEAMLLALVMYCRTYGAPDCYQNWQPGVLRKYIVFHSRQKTFSFVQMFGRIIGTGVAWQCNEADLRQALAEGKHVFQWQPNNPQGDSIFVADFVCSEPGALESLLQEFKRRMPNWEQLKLITFRHGRLVQYRPQVMKKLLRKEAYV